MTVISASLVKELRDATGAGMMDCKRALEEANGDLEAAKRLLRERGMASAAKRADRATTEGKVGYRIAPDGSRGTIVAVGCESEPVSKNEAFRAFAERLLETVELRGADGVDELEEERVELAGKIGENIRVVGAARYEAQDGEVLGSYVHPPANRLGVLLRLRGGTAELAREVAMHIAFARPEYVDRTEVPAADVDAERRILERQDDVVSKPEQVRGKIVQGRLDKWFGESVLVDQPWFRGTGSTVQQELGDAHVVEFTLLSAAG